MRRMGMRISSIYQSTAVQPKSNKAEEASPFKSQEVVNEVDRLLSELGIDGEAIAYTVTVPDRADESPSLAELIARDNAERSKYKGKQGRIARNRQHAHAKQEQRSTERMLDDLEGLL